MNMNRNEYFWEPPVCVANATGRRNTHNNAEERHCNFLCIRCVSWLGKNSAFSEASGVWKVKR